MPKMKWVKPTPETISYFERITPGPPIEARRMFGMPARFLNGHLLVGVFGNTFMLHLSPTDRAECIRAGAKPFAPLGREANAYVDVKPGLFADRELKEWIVRGMRYLGTLPPKPKGPKPTNAAKPGVTTPPRSEPARRVTTPAPPRSSQRPQRVAAKPAPKKSVKAQRPAAAKRPARPQPKPKKSRPTKPATRPTKKRK